MKNIYLYAVTFLLLLGGCKDYDDSSIRGDIDDYKQRIEVLRTKIEKLKNDIVDLSYLTNGNVITSVTKNADGKYVITYKDNKDEEKAVILVTQDDVIELPILGVRLSEDDNLYYWTVTTDNETTWLFDDKNIKIPVCGYTPEISVNKDGYWVINGEILTNKNGEPVPATTSETAIFKDIAKTENGDLKITLGNGEVLTLEVFNAINLVLKSDAITEVTDLSTPLVIHYEVTGEMADKAIIAVVQENNVKATIDTKNKTITVTFNSTFDEGHIIVTAYDLNHLVLRPLLFRNN